MRDSTHSPINGLAKSEKSNQPRVELTREVGLFGQFGEGMAGPLLGGGSKQPENGADHRDLGVGYPPTGRNRHTKVFKGPGTRSPHGRAVRATTAIW